MNGITALALKEFRSLFLSPLAWVVLAVMQFLLARGFLERIGQFQETASFRGGQSDVPGVTDSIAAFVLGDATLFLLILPLMTMRAIADERRNGTLPLLLSSPLSSTGLVLGKFAGLTLFNAVLCLMVFLMPLSLAAAAPLDWGKLAAGLLGLFLLLQAVAASGLFFSALTASPTLAAVGGYGLLLFLLLVQAVGGTGTGEHWRALLNELALMEHFVPFLKGLVRSRDVVYFLLFSGLFLALSVRRIEAGRLGA
jgi:ABC-2 type transport system permease protein